MRAEQLLPLLSSVRASGSNKWTALCPAHGDRVPSLSLSQKPDRVLLKCWAGCHIGDIVEAFGIRLSDLFTDRSARLDPQAERRCRAAKALENWRQRHIRLDAEDLRTRDIITRQIDAAFHAGTLTEDEAMISLEHEHAGYSTVEYRFKRLVRNQDTLQLWRESRAA